MPPDSADFSGPATGADDLRSAGTVRRITRWGEPVLHRRLQPVTSFDAELAGLVADLWATMYAAEGVGLAANQIGADRAVFVFDCFDDDGREVQGVVCNPVLIVPEGRERALEEGDEGCLSLPGAFIPCARSSYATVEGVDEAGRPVTYAGEGLLARCLQHETDHLYGRVFGDRLSGRARKRLHKQAASLAGRFPDDWPVSPSADR
ncbi:MAG: peptide deformylase [Nocardioidaceae bacterium]